MRSSATAALALAAASVLLAGCSTGAARQSAAVTGGESRRGAAAIVRYGCGSCHTIQGITGAHGLVGPPLTGVRNRMYVGGVLPNSPQNMARWIVDPKAIDEKTAMPRLGVTPGDANDIAAYLQSID